jgi:hypothetical protein
MCMTHTTGQPSKGRSALFKALCTDIMLSFNNALGRV